MICAVGYAYFRVFEDFRDEWIFFACVCEHGTFFFGFFKVVLVGGGMVSGGVSERGCCVLLN